MLILGIETSCDETAAAVVSDDRRILSNVVSSQVALHAPYGGVVPELASRQHLENVCPVIREAMATAGVGFPDLGAVAVTRGPGLIGCLLVGLQAAKGIAFVHGKPLVPVHHIAGHLEAPFLAHDTIPLPAVGLVVSGGHTSLFLVSEPGVFQLLARTRDDAAGEAFDKVAKLLGLGYPGGPIIDRLSRDADSSAVDFAVARLKDGSADFSFSGLKTAVLHHVKRAAVPRVGPGEEPSREVCDLVASFQRAAVDALVRNLARIAQEQRPKSLLLTGGVAANSRLRQEAAKTADHMGLPLFAPPLDLTSDNAAMIAAAGHVAYRRGVSAGWDLDAVATWHLG